MKHPGTGISQKTIVNGRRLFTPEENMENIADFYEKMTTVPYYPYHDEIIQNMKTAN